MGILIETYNYIFNKNVKDLNELHGDLDCLDLKQYKQLFREAAYASSDIEFEQENFYNISLCCYEVYVAHRPRNFIFENVSDGIMLLIEDLNFASVDELNAFCNNF